jgi:hypothetical protein
MNRKMNQNKWLSRFIIGTFVALYTLTSIVSTIHVIDFFELSNPYWLAVTLAIGFELGAAASLASLVILDKMNKTLVWALFITITLMQMQGNMYYAFTNLTDFQSWSELFDLIEEEPIYQKRILAFVSGAILPLVALGFIKSLVDYIKPAEDEDFTPEDSSFSNVADDEPIAADESDEDEALSDLVEEPTDIDENWDKDDALDQVLNNMASDIDPAEEEEIKVWEETINDGLDADESFEEDQLVQVEAEELPKTGDVEEAQDDEDLLEVAKRKVARENMKEFINEKRNGEGTANRA